MLDPPAAKGPARSRSPIPRPRRVTLTSFRALVLLAVALVSFLAFRSSHSPPPAPTVPRNLQLIQRRVVQPLRRGRALKIGLVGGSISASGESFGWKVVEWLNRNWPPTAKDREHELLQGAISASESGLASICLNTLFHHLPTAVEPPIDLLLVEFAYNDGGLAAAQPNEEGAETLAINRQANFERLFRTAMEWPVPVIVVEVSSYHGDIRLPGPGNNFFNSVGLDHAEVAAHYGVPVVDVSQLFHSWPDVDDLPSLFTDRGIHPNARGHNLIASLVIRELLFHISLSSPDEPLWGPSFPEYWSGPSWPVYGPSPAHGFPPVEWPPIPLEGPLPPLPAPRWQLGAGASSASWECVSSQIKHTTPRLQSSVISSATRGFTFRVDDSDGGIVSVSRPGYTTNETNAHVVFALGRHRTGPMALLYRRSWQPASGDALVWIDHDPAGVDLLPSPPSSFSSSDTPSAGGGAALSWPSSRASAPRCPPTPLRLRGHWTAKSTQMVLEEICAGEDAWSAPPDGGRVSFLHVVSVPGEGGEEARYFKTYGYAFSS
ncbi:hypothetical protein JCM10207_005160 [Rhodosporidiobolus poonsookiae]